MSASLYEVTPDPNRITESLRDTGYVLNTAVADVIDNSIAAGADHVSIELLQDPKGNVRFSVTDNGHGMDEDGLINALRYGSDHREDPSSLGKFGLGLKTASTSFARRIRVISRSKAGGSVRAAIWDLDKVKDIGWKIQVDDEVNGFDLSLLEKVSDGGSGTLVRWENIDRVIREYKEPTGTRAKAALQKTTKALLDHLSMVFQRFLDPLDDRAPNVVMHLNGANVPAWNPFGHGAECLLDDEQLIQTDSGDSVLHLRAFILPRKADMQAALGNSAPSEARLGNKNQGIYVYRENRMIHGPDWLGLWAQEPHFTLCRVELSFDHILDRAFQIDIKKSSIVLDTGISEYITDALNPPRREASIRYRDGERAKTKSMDVTSLHASSNAAIEDKAKNLPKAQLRSTDDESHKAEIQNPKGVVRVNYVPSFDKRVHIEAVEQIDDGHLYRPSYIGNNPGVLINKSHPYYEKVYLPNRNTGTTIQALDSLLWALAAAEFRSTEESTLEVFEDIRYDVSRALRKLVEDMPTPDLDES